MKAIRPLLIGIIIVGGLYWWWKTGQIQVPAGEQQKPTNTILSNDWSLGNPNAPVKVIEYSDLECPACRLYNGVGQQLVTTFGDWVGFAYRHFPLKPIHKNATLAAQAAEAAGKQGKFWEMEYLLFEKQPEWGESNQAFVLFAGYAATLGLEPNQFRHDIDSAEVKALVEADYLSGLVAKIEATPTFYINGQPINNLKGPEDLITRVKFELETATASPTPAK